MYQEHLKANEGWEARWENVQQLITFASEIDDGDERVDTYIPSDGATARTPTPESEFDDLDPTIVCKDGDDT